MSPHMLTRNAQTLEKEIRWFEKVIGARFALYFKNDVDIESIRIG